MTDVIKNKILIPKGSFLKENDYKDFIKKAYHLFLKHPQYLAEGEDINCLELAHILPAVDESILAIYIGINDAVCNKGLVAPFLLNHAHNNVFVFDPQVYSGGRNVPSGCSDAREILTGFEPPNDSWNTAWTYVMIQARTRTAESLWQEKGYIDMIPAKLEDFTLLTDADTSKICFFIDPNALNHPVNKARKYLTAARKKGDKSVKEFTIPAKLTGEFDALVPLVLDRGQKLYVANPDLSPCAHGWSNIHPDNNQFAVVNENSAVPLDLVINKPPVKPQYAKNLRPPHGSADMTTDWFLRGKDVFRKPLLVGSTKG